MRAGALRVRTWFGCMRCMDTWVGWYAGGWIGALALALAAECGTGGRQRVVRFSPCARCALHPTPPALAPAAPPYVLSSACAHLVTAETKKHTPSPAPPCPVPPRRPTCKLPPPRPCSMVGAARWEPSAVVGT